MDLAVVVVMPVDTMERLLVLVEDYQVVDHQQVHKLQLVVQMLVLVLEKLQEILLDVVE